MGIHNEDCYEQWMVDRFCWLRKIMCVSKVSKHTHMRYVHATANRAAHVIELWNPNLYLRSTRIRCDAAFESKEYDLGTIGQEIFCNREACWS